MRSYEQYETSVIRSFTHTKHTFNVIGIVRMRKQLILSIINTRIHINYSNKMSYCLALDLPGHSMNFDGLWPKEEEKVIEIIIKSLSRITSLIISRSQIVRTQQQNSNKNTKMHRIRTIIFCAKTRPQVTVKQSCSTLPHIKLAYICDHR